MTLAARYRVAAALAMALAGEGGAETAAAALGSDSRPPGFKTLVEEYVRLHRRLRASLPPLDVSSEPQHILKSSDQLASAIRKARAGARGGEVFNPVVVANFRARINYALRERDRRERVVRLLTEVEEDEDERPPAGWAPVVNGTLDWFSTGATPHSILEALPDLPSELQYRFVGLDLVLLDVDANLIVDILPGAVSVE